MTDEYGWPDKLKPTDIEALSKPLRKAFLQAVSLKKTQPASITYSGPEVTNNLGALAVGPSAKERLTEDGLAYDKERGRDSLDVMILLALQLGMEQGMRLFKERNPDYELLESYRETVIRLRTPAVDAVLAQLDNLSAEDLQLVIQTADNIRQDRDDPPPPPPPPELVESLAEELREISDIDISIPIQLQFQLQTRLKYQGPGHSSLDSLHFDSVTIKEQGKCTIPVEMVLLPHDGAPEGLLEEILMSFDPETPKDILLSAGAKKACPALVAHMARIEAFEGRLAEEGKKLDMNANELYDAVDWSAAPKKGKKKAGKKRATRMRY